MELVDRYLQAVEGYLPPASAQDIVAELKDSLLSQIEERERELGRELTADEQQVVLKQSGHPMLVAGRYLPQQYLIGPNVFPFWWLALRLMLTIVGLVYVVLAGVAIVSSGNPIQALFQAAFGFAETALVYIAVITVVFWLLEHYQVRMGFLDNWQPKKLAPIKGRSQIKRSESLFVLVVSVLFVFWWCGWLKFPALFYHNGQASAYTLSPAWAPYWWGILALAVTDAGLAVVNFISPWWKWDRLLLRILLNVIGIGLATVLFQQEILIVVIDAATEFGRHGKLASHLNQLMHGVLVILGLVYAVEIVQDCRRLLRP